MITSTRESIRLASVRTGASLRVIPLCKNISTVTEDEVVDSIVGNIQQHTRVIAITWVQSDTVRPRILLTTLRSIQSFSHVRYVARRVVDYVVFRRKLKYSSACGLDAPQVTG
jgi:hypothetical protein